MSLYVNYAVEVDFSTVSMELCGIILGKITKAIIINWKYIRF